MKTTIVPLILLFSCVTMIPVELRKSEQVIDTGIKKEIAYDRALVWFAKTLNNSNQAVQVKDKENARIVSNMRISCPALSDSIFYAGQFVDLSLDFQAKDSKARIRFENLRHFATNYYGNEFEMGPTSQEAVEEIRAKCLTNISDGLAKAVSGKSNDDF